MNGYTIQVLKPKSFGDADAAIASLKAGQVLLLNFSRLQPQSMQRVLDYIAGSTHALSGQYVEVGPDIVLFTPPGIEVSKGEPNQPYSNPLHANSA